MKRLVPALLVWAALTTPSFAQSAGANTLTVDEINAAIKLGMSGKDSVLFSRCNATESAIDRFLIGPGFHPDVEHFHVSVYLTQGLIAGRAAEARRLYKEITAADIPAALRVRAVFVEAVPHELTADAKTRYVPPAIEHVVLKPRAGLAAQPDDIKLARVEWPDQIPSGQAPPNKASVRFPYSPVSTFSAGEFDVVLVTKDGERRCKVGEKDRALLFGSSAR